MATETTPTEKCGFIWWAKGNKHICGKTRGHEAKEDRPIHRCDYDSATLRVNKSTTSHLDTGAEGESAEERLVQHRPVIGEFVNFDRLIDAEKRHLCPCTGPGQCAAQSPRLTCRQDAGFSFAEGERCDVCLEPVEWPGPVDPTDTTEVSKCRHQVRIRPAPTANSKEPPDDCCRGLAPKHLCYKSCGGTKPDPIPASDPRDERISVPEIRRPSGKSPDWAMVEDGIHDATEVVEQQLPVRERRG